MVNRTYRNTEMLLWSQSGSSASTGEKLAAGFASMVRSLVLTRRRGRDREVPVTETMCVGATRRRRPVVRSNRKKKAERGATALLSRIGRRLDDDLCERVELISCCDASGAVCGTANGHFEMAGIFEQEATGSDRATPA